jgi:nondiscriminating aspartyl-tRNA synthetase
VERIRTLDVSHHVGESIQVMGWLHNLRRLGGVNFLLVRDAWGIVQVVANEAELLSLQEAGAGVESVVSIRGTVVAMPQAPGGVELHAPQIDLLSPVVEVPPVTLNKAELKANLVTVLDHAVVANRFPGRRALLRLGSGIMSGFRKVLSERQFTEIQTPKIVASATESGANVFRLDYFGRPAYLAQSPQFYKQIMVGVLERVFEVGPVFRAEPHDTIRHVNEYVSLDVEMGFIRDHFDVMTLLRDVIAGIVDHLQDEYSADLATVNALLPSVPIDIPHVHFAEAQDLILRLHGQHVGGEPDLSPQDERWLGDWAREEMNSDFLFVVGYPMVKRPFYTHPDLSRPGFSNSFDLIFRGTELVTGGQRLHRFEDYRAALSAAKLQEDPFESYLEAFRYGMPPHGGFAIGLERFLTQLLDLPNVRLATTFPRDLHRLTP